MATVQSICEGAIRDIDVIGVNSPVPASDVNTALEKLNLMMMGLEADDLNVQWSEKALTDLFPLKDKHIEGVRAMLAEALTAIPTWETRLNREMVKKAAKGRNRLHADYGLVPKMAVPYGLRNFQAQ